MTTETTDYASKGVAGSGLGLGITGTVLGGLAIAGLHGRYATQATGTVTQNDLANLKELMAKDQQIAILQSENFTNTKLADVYERLKADINANEKEQAAVNAQQAVYNGTSTATLAGLQCQITQLQSLTKLVVPNSSVCPGWGPVTVYPTPLSANI